MTHNLVIYIQEGALLLNRIYESKELSSELLLEAPLSDYFHFLTNGIAENTFIIELVLVVLSSGCTTNHMCIALVSGGPIAQQELTYRGSSLPR